MTLLLLKCVVYIVVIHDLSYYFKLKFQQKNKIGKIIFAIEFCIIWLKPKVYEIRGKLITMTKCD